MSTKSIGDKFEKKAIEYLKENHFSIIEQNFYAKKLGEIDIIAVKNAVYHFIEVKSGANFEAIYNITPSKILKLKRSVSYYMQTKKITQDFCLDALIFQNEEIQFLENITF